MASLQFRNIALIAATGNLGGKILHSLRGAGFNVTAIQRNGSSSKVADGVKAVQVDLKSKSDLVAALRGQDVVVSAVPDPQLAQEKILFDAAIEAGVKRIVPSEFSSNLETGYKGKELHLDNVSEKLKIREAIEELGESGKIEWSSINNGPFLDLGVQYGFLGPNLRTKTATFHNGGDRVCCTTSTEDIGKAVALMLQKPAETKNKSLYVYSTLNTERKMTALVSKLTGIDFKITDTDVQKDADASLELIKAGETDKTNLFQERMKLYLLMMYGEGFGGDYRSMASNELLGLPILDEKALEEKVKGWLKEGGLL